MTEAPTIEDLLAPMLKRKVYVAISDPVPGGPDIREHLVSHLQHQIKLEKAGILLAAGPFVGPATDGPARGMFVLRARDRDEATTILDADPLHANGVREYQLHEWQINEGRISLTIDFSDQTYDLR